MKKPFKCRIGLHEWMGPWISAAETFNLKLNKVYIIEYNCRCCPKIKQKTKTLK